MYFQKYVQLVDSFLQRILQSVISRESVGELDETSNDKLTLVLTARHSAEPMRGYQE